ncbi:hypothetical protein L150_04496 [Candida albicans Ca529L]|nr:hypothetical protein L150_04496 [Candida albicans Ca529L]
MCTFILGRSPTLTKSLSVINFNLAIESFTLHSTHKKKKFLFFPFFSSWV